MEAVSKPDKFFLCFGFENFCQIDLKPFHVTLIYFGELTEEEQKQVHSIVSEYIEEGHLDYLSEYQIAFHEDAMFGPNKDIHVLLPTEGVMTVDIMKDKANRLFEKLLKFRKHNDYPFNPHLTTDLSFFKGRFDNLYLCKNSYEVVDAWGLEP